jgi:hypothetical protein
MNPLRDKSEDEIIGQLSEGGQFIPQTPIAQAQAEMQRRLIVATRAASDSADAQAAQMLSLNTALKVYTILLALIGVIQIALMLRKG